MIRNTGNIVRTTIATARRYAPEWIRAARRAVRRFGSIIAPAPVVGRRSMGVPVWNLGAIPPYGRWFRRGRMLVLMMS